MYFINKKMKIIHYKDYNIFYTIFIKTFFFKKFNKNLYNQLVNSWQ